MTYSTVKGQNKKLAYKSFQGRELRTKNQSYYLRLPIKLLNQNLPQFTLILAYTFLHTDFLFMTYLLSIFEIFIKLV